MNMIKLPEQLRQIKILHKYNTWKMTSEWDGLDKNNKMTTGCKIEKLRNNLSNYNWHWLHETIRDDVTTPGVPVMTQGNIPDEKLEQFFERYIEVEEFFKKHICDGSIEFSDWIAAHKGKLCQEFKRKLWALLVSGMECLEYLDIEDPHEDPDEDIPEHPLFVFPKKGY